MLYAVDAFGAQIAERQETLRRAAVRLEELRGENDNLWLNLREQTEAASR